MIQAPLWDRLARQTPADVAERTGAVVEGENVYGLNVLDERYRIDVGARTVEKMLPGGPAKTGYFPHLASVVYLLEARKMDPSGFWVLPGELPGGDAFFRGPHEIPVQQLTARFGSRSDAFSRACRCIGGRPEPHADVAYSFLLFPRIPVTVLLWFQDDEFPARASVLTDKTAGQHMPLDALWGAFHILQDRLVKVNPGK
ncbi:MAG: hypothetical protein A3K19_25295 [Lentisphaerae bacterium RIFOXYB12_FULL_65_16]|nr:MAG: hypothetical protein A3K18_06580 [Lentisphaerae bacterium RIFOXYA12_64_32]OGV91135.1 MAG: hypothetical protein A3K19_25295 [Lentisphaerae bacterium RIFOXYB12_FULL_65_16]